MVRKSFWRGYWVGLVLALGVGIGTLYYLFLRQPDITLQEMSLMDLSGRPLVISQLAGKPVVVNYWATWCGPCIEEFPLFEKAKKQAGEKVVFLMVSDEPLAKLVAFQKKHPYSFTFLRAAKPFPGVNVRPVTYGFDQSNTLVTKHSGTLTAQSLQALISSL